VEDRRLWRTDGCGGPTAVEDQMPRSTRMPLMAGNWKMNNTHLEAIALVQKLAFSLTDKDYDEVEVAVLPPFTALRSVQTLVDGDRLRLRYGAQDISVHDSGAYTGEVSGVMLAKLGCAFVVVGHSERREHHAESDALVNEKVKAALRNGLVPILCVGEGLDVRKEGRHVPHTLAQLDGALDGVPAEAARDVVIAYEPVWAIGTGEVATPEDAQEVCSALRGRLAERYTPEAGGHARVLYGGSVKGSNIAGIMAQPDVDGVLVGGASLDAEDFVRICRFREQAS
jgi:triosephosphate isomerase (TIM)